MAKKIGFIITAGHLDIEWYQPLHSYRFWTVEALEDLKKAAQREDFTTYLLDGQVYPLEEYLEVVPEDEPEMRALIEQGKLTIGPFYTQFDEWMPSAENMVRNCLFGKRISQHFGGWMCAGYLPDNFGHPYQMPQILNGFGIDSLMFMRGMPEIPGGHPDEFLYEGIDGSRVLVSHFRESYAGAFDIFKKVIDPIQPREVPYYPDYLSFEWHKELAVHDDPVRIANSMIDNVYKIAERYPSGIIPLVAGFDHLPPQINIGDSVKQANSMQHEIEFRMGTAEEYVRMVYANMQKPEIYNMELIGSRYQYVLLGALSTRTYLKRQNFACEALLERYAEPLTAMASLYGYQDKPRLLKEAWRYLLINSAHDSIHGSSVDEVHVEMEARFGASRQIASGVIHDALAYMGRHISHWWEPKSRLGVLTYAPVQTGFAQPVEVWLPIGDQSICMMDHEGKRLPTQILPREEVQLNGIGLPRNDMFPNPVYRKVLFMDALQSGTVQSFTAMSGSTEEVSSLAGDDTSLENEWVKVTIGAGLLSILDKKTGEHYYNLNLLEEDAEAGDAWDYAPPWIPGEINRSSSVPFTCKLKELGQVRAVLEMNGIMHVPACLIGDERAKEHKEMPLTFTVTLYRDIRRVDIKLRVDNTAKDHRVRLRIPMGVKTTSILSQGHLAVIDRRIARQKEIEPWLQPPTQLLPCREWIAANDGQTGLAIALKGLYDYEAVINPLTNQPDVFITLLRGFGMMGRRNTLQRTGAASDSFVTPGAQCLGEQVIEWSYVPYETNNEDKAPFIKTVQSFLYPPVAHAVRSKPEGEQLIKIDRIFDWGGDNLQFSALKKCYDGDGYILRLYENQGKETQTAIRINGFSRAWLSNLNEETLEELDVNDGQVNLAIAAYKAITLKLV